MNTISDYLNASYIEAPNKIAIVDYDSKLTYSELYDEVNRLSSYLNQFSQKSVISLLFDNTINFVISYLGVINSGCVAHLIPTGISQSNLIDQILSAKPVLILSSDNYFSKFSQIELEHFKKIKFSDIVAKPSNKRKPKSSDYAYLIYTSGTTSSPKGVPITHSNAVFTTNNIVKKLQYNKNDINLLPLSLSHSFGLGCLHTSLHVGSTLILQKNTDTSEIINSIEKNNVTTLAAIPLTLSKIVSNPNILLNKLSNLRLIITNSTFFPPETIKNLKDDSALSKDPSSQVSEPSPPSLGKLLKRQASAPVRASMATTEPASVSGMACAAARWISRSSVRRRSWPGIGACSRSGKGCSSLIRRRASIST